MSPTESPDRPPSRRLLTMLCLGGILLVSNPAAAQASGGSRPTKATANAQASATARASGPKTSRTSHSVTHRVVVRNGKTIVDERTENGRPARGGKGHRPIGKPGSALPFDGPNTDVKEMMERMRREMERGTLDLPRLDPRKVRSGAKRAADSTNASDSARASDSSRATRAVSPKRTGPTKRAGKARTTGKITPRRR